MLCIAPQEELRICTNSFREFNNLEVLFNSTSDSLFAMISSCCRNNLVSNSLKLLAVMDMI